MHIYVTSIHVYVYIYVIITIQEKEVMNLRGRKEGSTWKDEMEEREGRK